MLWHIGVDQITVLYYKVDSGCSLIEELYAYVCCKYRNIYSLKGLITILLMILLILFQCDAIEGYGAKLGKVSVFLITHLLIFAVLKGSFFNKEHFYCALN